MKENELATVLVVEDDEAYAMHVVSAVRRHGFEAVVAYSCHQAAKLLASGLAFVAAVVDVVLPDGNGFTIAEAVHARGLPVIVLTGHCLPQNANAAAKLPGSTFACKEGGGEEVLVGFLARLGLAGRRTREFAVAHHLNVRQGQILYRRWQGLVRKDIASKLGISEAAIKRDQVVIRVRCSANGIEAVDREFATWMAAPP